MACSASSGRPRSSPRSTGTSAPRSTTRSASPPRSRSGSPRSSSSSPASSSRRRRSTYAEGTVLLPRGRRLVQLRAPRLQRGRELRGGLGPDAQLHHHDRHLGVLRPALPVDLLGAAEDRSRGTSSSAPSSIALLVVINIVGVREAARLNIGLAVIDFATQLLLVIIGFALIFSPHTLVSNVHFGVAPTWSNFFLAIPVAMIAYTGIETISNLAEEARDPSRTSRARPAGRDRGLRDLLHAAGDRPVGAPGATEHACKIGHYQTQLAPAARGVPERPGARPGREPRHRRHDAAHMLRSTSGFWRRRSSSSRPTRA